MRKEIFEVAQDIIDEARTRYNEEITFGDALNIAVQIQRNEILKQAFVITAKDDTPTALEAIAIALGYK